MILIDQLIKPVSSSVQTKGDSYIGLHGYYSHQNNISFNNITNNDDGILLSGSNNNNVSWNTLRGNTFCITEYYCSGNVIENNDCDSNPPEYPSIPGFEWIFVLITIMAFILIAHANHRENPLKMNY